MFSIIALPYTPEALEPVISAQTLSYHHGKHLQAYVDNLNKLTAGTAFDTLPLEEIVKQSTGALYNNAGQVLNHNLYFTQFTPNPEESSGKLLRQIEKQWGTLDAFKAEFESKGVTLFGSGWVWLSADEEGTLHITQEPNAGNPVTRGHKPLLTFDVWEHAYYLDYQNRRAAHLQALWQIVNWQEIERRYNR
ncbi:MAG: superoxide dismutase [Bacteroidaceae bacterium]|nr:superoxide dismutase [Bacteroidaceae bacterium]